MDIYTVDTYRIIQSYQVSCEYRCNCQHQVTPSSLPFGKEVSRKNCRQPQCWVAQLSQGSQRLKDLQDWTCVHNTLNVFMNHQGEPLLSTQNIRLTTNNYIMMFLVSCLAKKVRKVSSTCISCQVLSFWAVQVHAEPPRPSCRKNTSIFAKTPHFSSPSPVSKSSLQGFCRDSQCPIPVQGENIGPDIKTYQTKSKHIKEVTNMDKPSFSGSFWLRYLSIVANRLKRWSLVCAWCICLQWSLYPPFKEQFPPVWTHFKERLWIVSILALIKLSPNAGTSPEDLRQGLENGTYRFSHVNLILHAPKLLAEDRSPHVEM